MGGSVRAEGTGGLCRADVNDAEDAEDVRREPAARTEASRDELASANDAGAWEGATSTIGTCIGLSSDDVD